MFKKNLHTTLCVTGLACFFILFLFSLAHSRQVQYQAPMTMEQLNESTGVTATGEPSVYTPEEYIAMVDSWSTTSYLIYAFTPVRLAIILFTIGLNLLLFLELRNRTTGYFIASLPYPQEKIIQNALWNQVMLITVCFLFFTLLTIPSLGQYIQSQTAHYHGLGLAYSYTLRDASASFLHIGFSVFFECILYSGFFTLIHCIVLKPVFAVLIASGAVLAPQVILSGAERIANTVGNYRLATLFLNLYMNIPGQNHRTSYINWEQFSHYYFFNMVTFLILFILSLILIHWLYQHRPPNSGTLFASPVFYKFLILCVFICFGFWGIRFHSSSITSLALGFAGWGITGVIGTHFICRRIQL